MKKIKTRTTASGLTRHKAACNKEVLWDKKNKVFVCPKCNPKRAAQLLKNKE
jgi:predicted RNA-binding Zn-ribbon protein involved in translation (DUF1610 family)